MDIRIFILSLFTEEEFKELQKGNKKQLEDLYFFYKDIIFDFLMVKLNGNRDIAEDLLSETFVSVLSSVSGLKNQGNIKGWVISIALNLLRTFFKKNRYRRKVIEFIKEQKAYLAHDIMNEIEKKYKYSLIRTAMDKLKPDKKRILSLKYVQKRNQKDIAATLNKTEGAVEQSIIRAKRELRKEIHILDKNFFK